MSPKSSTGNAQPAASAHPIEAVLRCRNTGPPPFMPAIYEHKAWFIRDTPSRVGQNVDLFEQAVLTEHERIGADALVIGMDVYNIEAEAAGCRVTYYTSDDPSIPGIGPGGHIVKLGDDVAALRVPNPARDGRMPLHVEVARRVVRAVGDRVWVRGALSGPFSLAVSLMGSEDLFVATLEEPEFVQQLLRKAAEMTRAFGRAYLDVGADVVIFDSQATCDLLSPETFRAMVQTLHAELVADFKAHGARDVPLILGGNTTPIREELIAAGGNNLLCDFKANWPDWLASCQTAGRALRRNLPPALIQTGTPEAIYAAARQMIAESQGYAGFILGTAVVSYGTPDQNVLAARDACRSAPA